MSSSSELDYLDLEFQYYCSLLEKLVFLLPNQCQQFIANKWNTKLTDPIYNAEYLRQKRNHYLLMLTISLSLGDLIPPFDRPPPNGVLEDLHALQNPNKIKSNLKSYLYNEPQKPCDFHEIDCPPDDDNICQVLDEQFEFLMNLSNPHVENLTDVTDRRRATEWIKFLSSINTDCYYMKGVRNDYAMLLSGYVMNNELAGPFLKPPIENLVSLCDLVKILDMDNHMVIDPSHPLALRFLKDVPLPKEGAFAFLGVTGNIS